MEHAVKYTHIKSYTFGKPENSLCGKRINTYVIFQVCQIVPMPAHHFPVGSSMTTLHLCSDGTYLYWVWSPASLNEKTQKGHSVFMDVFHLSVSTRNYISYTSFSCIQFVCAWLWFIRMFSPHSLSCPRCRRKQGCVLQTLCRRELFSPARKASPQSAWTSFCWVECLASEPPILPHWLLLRDPQSPTLSKKSNLVLYHQHPNSHSVRLVRSVKYSLLRHLFNSFSSG